MLHGPDGYDKVVDSWSLGVMVYMMSVILFDRLRVITDSDFVRLTKCNPFRDGYSPSPNWFLLHEYNIVDDGT